MASIDVSNLVPSARDFLQAIATRRKRLALVPLVESVEDARRVTGAGVAAIAVAAPGDVAREIARTVGGTPVILLQPVASSDDALVARASGADAVVVAPDAGFEALAKSAQSTRMAVLAFATDHDSARRAAATGAKALVLHIYGVEPVASVLQPLEPTLRVLVHVPAADEKALRALRGKVDAAIVESELFLSTSFETLREELDP